MALQMPRDYIAKNPGFEFMVWLTNYICKPYPLFFTIHQVNIDQRYPL